MIDAENNNEEKKIRATIKPTKHVLFMSGFPPFATREDIVTELLRVGGAGIEDGVVTESERNGNEQGLPVDTKGTDLSIILIKNALKEP